MKNDTMRIFLCGDVFGPVGMRCVTGMLPGFIEREEIDFTVVNGENATGGIGISTEDARAIFASGADAITGGNHTFEKRDFWSALDELPGMLRPANFPSGEPLEGMVATPGRGFAVFEKDGFRVAVLNLQGREDMVPLDCPFRCADRAIAAFLAEPEPPVIVVDFHAESSEEKEALAFFLDGKASAVVGTHTHVQTADERILSGGTAYMTDLGMTGPLRSVIGVDPEFAVKRNVTQVLYRMEPYESRGALRGLLVDIDPSTRKATSVRRIQLAEAE
ncbi:MAG TPA: TIGR00282 family metallophosphoesterase [Treponemataceae bacterium]|nr:TIGR00282 family metallophosphoesterase [Treponemataceae bacterium]